MESEAEPLESFTEYELEDQEQGNRPRILVHRSSSDAKASRPRLRVEFNTLPLVPLYERQLSDQDVELLSSRAHQIGRANWSGGWQNTILTRRRKGLNPRSEEDVVTEIAQAMVNDQRLMADDVDGEVMRRDALRELTKSLRVRKEIKRELTIRRSSIRSSLQQNITCYNAFKYSLSMKWFKFKLAVRDTLHDYSLWHKDLKDIESIYGSSIGSYFSFLRYLFIVNLIASFAIVGFLLIPQQLYDHYYKGNETIIDNETASHNPAEQNSTYYGKGQPFRPLDLFTGAGWFSDTQLYYGGYSYIDGPVFSLFNFRIQYDMSQAYFFTILLCFSFYLFVFLHRIFELYKTNYFDTDEDVKAKFVEKVLCVWDYNITDAKAASIKHRSIYNELIEMLQEYSQEEEISGFFARLWQKIVNFGIWGILFAFLALLGFSLFVLLRDGLNDFVNKDHGYWRTSFELLVYPLIVTLIMSVVPAVFEVLGRFEKYKKPRHELYFTLIRVTLLQLTVLVVLVSFWYSNSPGLKTDSDEPASQLDRSNSSKTVQCWETALGEEIYRLVFFDFLAIFVSVLIIDTSKKRLVSSGKADKMYLQFNLPRNILHIIYNQTLLWAGMFFCPLLPLVISIKFLIIFYLQKFNVMRNLQPLDRPFRAAHTETLYYTLTLFSFILCLFNLVFILIRGYCSDTCGPFQAYTHYGELVLSVSEGNHQYLLEILAWSLQPNALFLFTIILSIAVYCVKNLAEGRAELVGVLREQFDVELKDRVFLQRLIGRVQRGEHVPGSPRSGPSSPVFEEDENSKYVTRRSSFVFSRSRDSATSAL